MLFYTGLFFLVIAVSLDGFGVGIAYGMRRIRVPLIALFIIMFCSGVIVLASMVVGNMLSAFISVFAAKVLGGLILILLGLYCFWNMIRSGPDASNSSPVKNNSQFNQITSVMKEPKQADLDQSGVISALEAVLLGFALALDAFAAGIGAAMLGYSPPLTAVLVALMSGLLVISGIKIGLYLSGSRLIKKIKLLPPLLLITLGIVNILS